MQTVEWTDDRGRKRCRLVHDVLDDPREGVPLEPPDVDRLDWEAVKATLHNQLMERGLLDAKAVQRNPNAFIGAIFAALRRPLLDLYREHLAR